MNSFLCVSIPPYLDLFLWNRSELSECEYGYGYFLYIAKLLAKGVVQVDNASRNV